jgi:hypothetical protein
MTPLGGRAMAVSGLCLRPGLPGRRPLPGWVGGGRPAAAGRTSGHQHAAQGAISATSRAWLAGHQWAGWRARGLDQGAGRAKVRRC